MKKISTAEKIIFQEAYRLSRLPVFNLQLLLASVMPKFEVRVNELDKKWKTRQIILRKDRSAPPVIKLLAMPPSKRGRAELARKVKLETKTAQYGRRSIEEPWYDTEHGAISSYRCHQYIKPPEGIENPRNRSHGADYIGVHVISITLRNRVRLKVLVLMERVTMLVSLRAYKNLGWKSIVREVDFFRDRLDGIGVRRQEIRVVNSGFLEDGEPLAKALDHLKTRKNGLRVEIDPAYVFQEGGAGLFFDADEEMFRTRLPEMMVAYNIGVFRKRTGPFLALKRHFRNRTKYIKDEDLAGKIEEVLKLRAVL